MQTQHYYYGKEIDTTNILASISEINQEYPSFFTKPTYTNESLFLELKAYINSTYKTLELLVAPNFIKTTSQECVKYFVTLKNIPKNMNIQELDNYFKNTSTEEYLILINKLEKNVDASEPVLGTFII